MAKVGDRRKQKNSPGTGWVKTGETGDGTNIWTYKGKKPSRPSNPPSGGGGGGGGAGSGGGGSGSSASDKKKQRQKYIDAYNNFMDPTGKKQWKPTDKMIDLAVKNDWSMATMYTWVRQFDSNYLQTAGAKSLMSDFRTMISSVFGNKFRLSKESNKKLYNAMIDYAKLPVDKARNKTTVMNVFKKDIITTAKFKQMYPYFNVWFNSTAAARTGVFAGLSDPVQFVDKYTSLVELYTRTFKEEQLGVGNVDAEIPVALLMTAMRNNWPPDGIEWRTAVRNTGEYMGSAGAEMRRQEFETNWESIFRGTQFEDIEPDETLMEQYMKGTTNYTAFFNSVMNSPGSASAAMIDAAFPSYNAFIEANPQYLSGQLDLFGEGGYFDRRLRFIELYKQMVADPDALPPVEFLDRALAGSWFDSQWQMYVRENDPAWQTSPIGEARLETLERYWDALFGQDAAIDPDIEKKWMLGETNTPEDLLGDIQNTELFKTNYPNYADFQKRQVEAGAGAQVSPGMYKLYDEGFDQAFLQNGMDPEQFGQLKRAYFGSNLQGEEFKSYITEWSNRKDIFQVTTGTKAPMEVATGLAKPEQGGAVAGATLRKRMEDELEKYRTFVKTGPQSVIKTGEQDNLYKQKI